MSEPGDEVDGWVLPATPGLGQRPLILGLPYPAAGGLILAAMSMSLLAKWEVMMRAARYPGRLDAG
ncbi:MAG: hypothetical protein MUD06_11835 [Rhodospirillales bacterium]|nr:hypothetical protein [Rhodospirillales bacterium]